MLKRLYLPVALSILVVSAACLAEKKRIRLKGGRVIVGEVIEKTKEGIKVQGKIAVVFYKHEQIEAIEDIVDPKVEYRKRLAALKKGDAAGQVALGEWALDRKMYKEAVQCFKAALKIDKSNERASLRLRQAKAKLGEAAGGDNGGEETNGGTETIDEKLPFDRKLLIQTEDIYRIRLEELREADRINVRLRNDVIGKFIQKMRGVDDFEQKGFDRKFRRWPKARQAKYILAKADRDDRLKDGILVTTDPLFMREFRGPIWRWISGSCASTQCHGAGKGKGKLKLFNYPGQNSHVDYTNFLILDSYHRTGGKQMIRRDNWEGSLLLQYGLPVSQAEHRHPKKIRPAFKSRQAAGYKQTLRWIQELSGPRHPSYRIKHRPPNAMAPPAGLPGLRTLPKKPKTGKEPEKKKPDTPF